MLEVRSLTKRYNGFLDDQLPSDVQPFRLSEWSRV
jgi:hypothetical protein